MKNIIKKVAMKYGIFKRKVAFKNYDIWFYVFFLVILYVSDFIENLDGLLYYGGYMVF